MSKRIRPFQLVCSGTSLKKCHNKSTKESSVQLAFSKAEKNGWSQEIVSDKCTRYYCPGCTHKRKNILKVA